VDRLLAAHHRRRRHRVRLLPRFVEPAELRLCYTSFTESLGKLHDGGKTAVAVQRADFSVSTDAVRRVQVQRLRKAQELHDRKMWDERRCGKQGSQPWIDYLRPIIADGDTG
jgi:hypothetical protein